jgi:hypothetical protein
MNNTENDLDPALAHAIEETLLFGKPDDLKNLLDRITDDVRVPDAVRYGLESLLYFRAHYAAEVSRLSEEARQHVIKFDADWTMRMIQKLHRRAFGAVEDKQA